MPSLLDFQRDLESRAAGSGTYFALAPRVGDILVGSPSTAPGGVEPSHTPGVNWTDLSLHLAPLVVTVLCEAIPVFDRQVSGVAMEDAVMAGVGIWTSSPIRVTRGTDFHSLNTSGFYPADKGASHVGGILSAGVDGIKVAESVTQDMVGGC